MTETNSNTSPILRWVDEVPPSLSPGRSEDSKFKELFDTLQAHPGQWAQVGDGKAGVGAGSSGFLRSKGFEVRTRKIEGDERDSKGRPLLAVYAMFPAPAEEAPS